MSCWRVLRLSGQLNDEHIPQLLVKPQFGSDAYTLFLTDLSNIWSEELDLDGIALRASTQQSPIEVSKHDTTQLTILLDNIQRSLETHHDTTCRITKTNDADADTLILHTTITLPEPLDSLNWKFHLRKRSPVTLKNELILPLLVSSHIQVERIAGLIGTISEKDRAITRLTDQFESANMDLAAAFPSIGGIKSGRRAVTREQAAKHVPGLRQFDEDSWRSKTANLQGDSVSTLGMFQEALANCTPQVPHSLKSSDGGDVWWSTIDSKLKLVKPGLKAKPVVTAPALSASETDDDETEDEFETHENFKLRQSRKDLRQDAPLPPRKQADQFMADVTTDDDEKEDNENADDDDDDLDAPISKSQSQSQPHPSIASPPEERSVEPHAKDDIPLLDKAKSKGFRIGGKFNRTRAPSATPDDISKSPGDTELPIRSNAEEEPAAIPKPPKKSFKIGGKSKQTTGDGAGPPVQDVLATAQQQESVRSTRKASTLDEVEQTEEKQEETAEEKAERKRQELKRKNEELAKKQAQSKKKRRF
ncbi:XLF-domain-containing protein [Periconia macrospinosa]|uniref:Non-homologous end-joining factor 1 n=1 Tax=Periconia macrospinosa TaxID=97972 RepID=A0A2V1DLW3_9PLEO|nr:XLF-domain-containing protein [Periconia macrospinosa]